MTWKKVDTWLVVRWVGRETHAELFKQETAARSRLEELRAEGVRCHLDRYVGWREQNR